MRIIAGSRARAVLVGPRDLRTRPITDRVKESLFSILQWRLEGARVVDLFCGTGSLGLEALSRGAAWAVLAEKDRSALERLKQNIVKLGFGERAHVAAVEAFRCGPGAMLVRALGEEAGEQAQADVVFVDPPYRDSRASGAESPLGVLLTAWGPMVSERGVVAVRHERRVELAGEYGVLLQADRREYGSMAITFLEKGVE